jgi:large subunit ribosomal protein L22
MIVRAQAKFLRISPLKTRQVIRLIQKKDVIEALGILLALNKRPSYFLKKLLQSAIHNAEKKGFSPEQLYISKITADGGPIWKRYRAAAFGRATMIRRRTTHLKIELDVKT